MQKKQCLLKRLTIAWLRVLPTIPSVTPMAMTSPHQVAKQAPVILARLTLTRLSLARLSLTRLSLLPLIWILPLVTLAWLTSWIPWRC